MRVLLNSPAFQNNYGLRDDEVRSVYGNVEALATHIMNWYFEHTPYKLGGEYLCRIITFDQENVNGKRLVGTLRFSATNFQVSDVSTRDQWGQPVFELEGEALNLNELVRVLQNRVESEANRIAIYLARYKLGQLGVLQHHMSSSNVITHYPLVSEYHKRFFEEEFARTLNGKR